VLVLLNLPFARFTNSTSYKNRIKQWDQKKLTDSKFKANIFRWYLLVNAFFAPGLFFWLSNITNNPIFPYFAAFTFVSCISGFFFFQGMYEGTRVEIESRKKKLESGDNSN
jgi:hypothetical protein